MRQILSTAIVALVVAALTAVSVSALAQSSPATDSTYSPSSVSNINADRVDGKHAVGAKATIPQRKGKLVATDKTGFLPRNIVKPLWPLIQNKPAALADGEIAWDEVQGIPAGFADGVDDGIVQMTTTQAVSANSTINAGGNGVVTVTCPANSHVISGGFGASSYLVFSVESFQSGNGWIAVARNTDGSAHTIFATAVCLTTNPLNALRTRNPIKARDLLPRGK
jgi:hypothetical protein